MRSIFSLKAIPIGKWSPLFKAVPLIFLATASTARANFVTFVVSAPGETALVSEQISFVPGGGGLLDYEFLVSNIGPLPIDGFFLATGAPGAIAAALIAGGGTFPAADLEFASAADPGNGPFPAVAAGGAPNTPLAAPFEEGATNPLSPILVPFWGFEQFDDGAGGPPASYYAVGWYTGFPGPGALPALQPGFVTRFDLFSFFGPVQGFGGIDPFSDSLLGIVDINPNGIDFGSLSDATDQLQICGTAAGMPACDSTPNEPTGFGGSNTPEPFTFGLVGGALLAISWKLYRRA